MGKFEINGQEIGDVRGFKINEGPPSIDVMFPRLVEQPEISGTFAFTDIDNTIFADWARDEATDITLYGPANLPWWKAWFYILFRRPWPEQVLFSGKVVDNSVETDEDGTVRATFTASGHLTLEGPMVRDNPDLKEEVQPELTEEEALEEDKHEAGFTVDAVIEEPEYIRGDIEPDVKK